MMGVLLLLIAAFGVDGCMHQDKPWWPVVLCLAAGVVLIRKDIRRYREEMDSSKLADNGAHDASYPAGLRH